jgi:hypothetical protein
MNQVLGLPVVGALTLAFDRQIAEALVGVSLAILVLKKQPDYQRKIPPVWAHPSRSRFDGCLIFVRWWGAAVALTGIGFGLDLLAR